MSNIKKNFPPILPKISPIVRSTPLLLKPHKTKLQSKEFEILKHLIADLRDTMCNMNRRIERLEKDLSN
mgnify:CR=1|jgi:hypothetical protein